MRIKRFIEQETKTQTYLVVSDINSAVIIDPVYQEVERYLSFLELENIKLKYVLDTHIHADHITGSALLRQKTSCKIAMSEHANIDCVDVSLADGDELVLDELSFTTIYTPGHTIESCSYLLNDRLFTGDALLINACGRTDFQNGSARELYHSLFNKLLKLPDETLVYPGHDYNNRTVSTIFEEKMNNPRLQVTNCDEFVAIMDNLNLPKPKYIDVAVPRNLACGLEHI